MRIIPNLFPSLLRGPRNARPGSGPSLRTPHNTPPCLSVSVCLSLFVLLFCLSCCPLPHSRCEARKGELRSGLQFGRHSDFIQPSELEKDRRQWFQGSVLGASAALAYLTHRYVTKPGLVVGNLGFALQFWMNVGVSAALTPVVSWVFLPYPNSPSYDLLHGNMHVICRDVGAGYGLAFVAANSGLKLRAAPQLFLGFLLGRFAGHATAGFLFPKNIKGEVDDSYRITFLKAESDPSPPKARAAAVADQSAPDATEDASSNTGLKQHGTGYEDEAVGDEWERKMQEKAKRITSSNAGGQPQP